MGRPPRRPPEDDPDEEHFARLVVNQSRRMATPPGAYVPPLGTAETATPPPLEGDMLASYQAEVARRAQMSPEVVKWSRGKVWLHLVAGESLGRPLAEWGYRTPRFPRGIKGSDLSETTPEIQRETMVVWFLINHVPATGTYFGFSGPTPTRIVGPLNTAATNSMPTNQIKIGGFGQGTLFHGGRSHDLLKAEFAELVPEPMILDVAGLFDGLWQRFPPETFVDFARQTPEEREATLVSLIDDLTEQVRQKRLMHGGMGHNGPPPMTEDETNVVLRATADARLAVLSSDYRTAELAWETMSPVVQKLGASIAKQVENYCTKFTSTVAITTALMATGYLGYELGFWNKAEAISAMLEIAKHLPVVSQGVV
jgi:hypothetical protein